MKRWILMIGLMLGLFGWASAQEVEATAKVQDDHVAVGKPFPLDLTMKVPYGYYVEWNDFATDTLSAQIDILKRGDLVRTADADSNIIVQQQLTLMTFDTGYVQIPPVSLTFAKSAEDQLRMKIFTDPVQLYATTIAVDTTQSFRPLMEPIEQPVSMKEVFPWIMGVLILVLVGLAVWYFVKRRKPKVDENGEPIAGPVIPPYNKAINDLESLKQQKLWQAGKLKDYYSGLSDIAREYIEGQFNVNAVEMTTDEILQEVSLLDFDQSIYRNLKDTMELSDLVKFAKYTASSLENDNAMTDMTDFVNKSYEHYQAVKAKEEEVDHA
ncbi:MAG: hypothetical protein J6P73_10010 [Bacteroidales bacterium]|nr:hypothetical protein [Bacteroidales bacterium]